jgi:outer membrane lipoprotein-sorting protein
MNRRIPMIARFIALSLLSVPVSAVAASPRLDQVVAHLNGLSSLSAAFAQTDRNGRTLTGTLTLKRPGKVRFQYQKDVPLLIVGDGRALSVIDYQVNQVQRWPIGDSPLAVLLDPQRNLARVAEVVAAPDPSDVWVRARDPKHPEYGTITLTFRPQAGAPGGLTMTGWMTVDAQNNRSSVRLSGQRYNQPVADTAFRWRDPRVRVGPR